MANEVVPFEKAQLPAHLAESFQDATNIEARMSLPTLSLRGKVWRLIVNGEEKVIAQRDPSTNEMVPKQIVEFVVVDMQPRRSRAYFEGPYDDSKKQKPTCWSTDSIKPDDSVPDEQVQCEACAKCPQAIKGAKVTDDGKKVAACSMFKRLAVVPPGKNFAIGPLAMKLPITSLWDKDASAEGANGWYAWDQYAEFLLNRGVKYTGLIVTAAKFDQSTSYPKVMFKAVRYITADEVSRVQELRADPITKQICFGDIPDAYQASADEHEAGQADHSDSAPATAPAAPQKPAAPPPAAAAPAAPAKPRGRPAAPKGAAPAKAAPKAAPPAAAAAAVTGMAMLDEDDAPPAAAQQSAGTGGASGGEDLDAIIEGWDG